MNTISIRVLATLLLFAVASPFALSQTDFPAKPIRLLVGFPPPGSTDALARALSFEGRKLIGQDIVVVNRPGASGVIAINEVAAASPDGYTLGITPSTALTLAHHFMAIRPDLLDIINPLLMAGRQRVGMVTKSDSPFKTLKDLVIHARANPGKLSIGIPGLGTSVEVFTRAILQHEKLNVAVVPYKGDAEVTPAVLGGHVSAASTSSGGWAQQVQAGTMRLLASFEADRFAVAPEVPTLEELGYGLIGAGLQVVYAPKGMPAPVARKVILAFSKAMRTPTFIDVATKNGLYDKNPLDGDQLNAYLLKDRVTNAALVEKVGLKKKP